MPFDRGNISCRVCLLPQPMPEDALSRFSGKRAGSLDGVRDEVVWGWVSGRHLLETRIDEETGIFGGYLHLQLRQAVRKIPASLLRAECRMRELAEQAERKMESLPRKEKKRIKEEVTAEMLPKMPPQISGITFVVDAADNKLYTGAISQTQLDIFLGFFCDTIGFEPVPLTPEIAPTDLFGINPDVIPQINFSPEIPDGSAAGTLGQNFLTWLWFFQEEYRGVLPKTQLGEFSMMLDGPLIFVAEGPGAHESSIRKGLPMLSAEAKAALLVGKKLKQAKLIIARGRDEVWAATIDADTFAFKGIKLPEGEALDPNSIFEERITNLYVLQTIFFQLYRKFLTDLSESGKRQEFQRKAKDWVKNRESK